MNKELMKDYVEFISDRLLFELTKTKFYNKNNPFEWMDLLSLEGKTNFIKKRVSEYQKAGVLEKEFSIFNLIEDF